MVRFMQKKDHQISSGIRLATGDIHVFTRSVSCLNKAKLRAIEEEFFNLVLCDVMLDDQLFDYVRQPDEVINIHNRATMGAIAYARRPRVRWRVGGVQPRRSSRVSPHCWSWPCRKTSKKS